jgi:hypothetical protein
LFSGTARRREKRRRKKTTSIVERRIVRRRSVEENDNGRIDSVSGAIPFPGPQHSQQLSF